MLEKRQLQGLEGPVLAGLRVPRSQMLLDPVLVLGLPGQNQETHMGLQAMDKMQGEVLQGNIHLLVLTTPVS